MNPVGSSSTGCESIRDGGLNDQYARGASDLSSAPTDGIKAIGEALGVVIRPPQLQDSTLSARTSLNRGASARLAGARRQIGYRPRVRRFGARTAPAAR